MDISRLAACAAGVVLLAGALTGCSMDAVIWGPGGAEVIATTEDLIDAMAAGDQSDLICAGSVADLGDPSDWIGLAAGEPERFVADYWQEQVPLEPKWNINLEGLPQGAEPGTSYPGDVFYQETSAGLCVIDIVWSRLVSVG